MNKGIKHIIYSLLIIFSFIFVGCNKPKEVINTSEAESYNIVHKGYVGRCVVKVENDKVKSVSYDEAFLPHTWANIELEENQEIDNNVIEIESNGNKSYYAKYISIDSKIFEGKIREEELVLDNVTYSQQKINYGNSEIPDLFRYMYNSDSHCEWYFKNVLGNKVFMCDKDGKRLENYKSKNTYGSFKSEGKYWNDKNVWPIGWEGNLKALEQYMVGKKLVKLDESSFKKEDNGTTINNYTYNYWTIDGVKTGVTMVDIYDYYNLALSAYNKAIQMNK